MEGMGPGGTLKAGFSMSITMSPPNLQPYCSVTFIVNVLGPVPLFLLPPGLYSIRSYGSDCQRPSIEMSSHCGGVGGR